MKPLIGPPGRGALAGQLCTDEQDNKNEALSGVLGNKAIYFRGTGEQMPIFEGNWGTRTLLGNMEHKNKFSIFGEQANLFQGNKGTGTPPPPLGGPKNTLNSIFDILKLISLFTVSSHKETLSNVVN